MTKLLILFHSLSGNTQTMAHSIGEGASSVSDIEIRILSTAEATHLDLEWCDGIAVGSPTNFGTVSGDMKSWWGKFIESAVAQ